MLVPRIGDTKKEKAIFDSYFNLREFLFSPEITNYEPATNVWRNNYIPHSYRVQCSGLTDGDC